MAGFAPPLDAPPPGNDTGAGVTGGASFAPSPSGPSLCGFTIPTFSYFLGFRLPGFPPFAFPPTFNFLIRLNCDLSNPLSASFGFGGGRVSTIDKDADPEYGEGLADAA